MLLPALNKARDRAKTIKCISQLKQMGLGVALYAGSFDGFLPRCAWKTALDATALPWDYVIAELINDKQGEIFRCPADNKPAAVATESINSYIANKEAHSATGGADIYEDTEDPSLGIRSAKYSPTGKRMATLKNPKVLFAVCANKGWQTINERNGWSCGVFSGFPRVVGYYTTNYYSVFSSYTTFNAGGHSNGTTYFSVDGSAKWIGAKEIVGRYNTPSVDKPFNKQIWRNDKF